MKYFRIQLENILYLKLLVLLAESRSGRIAITHFGKSREGDAIWGTGVFSAFELKKICSPIFGSNILLLKILKSFFQSIIIVFQLKL